MSYPARNINVGVSMENLSRWVPRPVPGRVTLEGRFCRLEPLDARPIDDPFDSQGPIRLTRTATLTTTAPTIAPAPGCPLRGA